MKNIFSLRIQSKIIIPMLGLSLIPLTIFMFLFIEQYQNDLRDTEFLKLQTAFDLKNDRLTFLFSNLESDIDSIFSDEWFLSTSDKISMGSLGNNVEQNLVFFLQSEPAINEILITDSSGNVLVEIEESEVHRDNFDDVDFAVNSYFSSDLSKFHYTDVYQDEKGNYALFLVLPKTVDGVTFLMIFEVNLSYVYSLIVDHSSIGDTGEVLVGQKLENGAEFIHPLKYDPEAALSRIIQFDESRALPIRESVQGISNCGSTVDYRSEPILACWGPTHMGWGMVAKIDQSEVFSTTNTTILTFVLIFLFTTGSIVLISRLVSKGIQKPLLKLQDAFKEFNSGKYDTEIKIKGNDEVADLTKSFQTFQEFFQTNDKIKNFYQKELEVKLEESANFKKSLDESANVSITDADGTILYVNDKFRQITKYSDKELIGQNHRILKSGFHPPQFYATMWKTVSSGKIWNGDIKNRAKNGDEFWVKTTIVPFLGKDGKPFQYIAVRTDITRQKLYESKLMDALKEVRRIDQLKNEFASMVTHELKTPLTPIRGYCEMLKDSGLGELNSEQLECIDTIDSNASNLERLIGDILDSQKLDMGQLSFSKKDFNLSRFLENLKKNVQPLLKEKNVQFFANSVDDVSVNTDEQRLQQIFYNLIRNAVDFIPENNGIIEIGIIPQENNFRFFVKDNGIGIPKEKQPNIFKKFYQVDTAQTRKHGGTGLGLVICKGIVEGLGGKIWFESNSEGTTFYFELPLQITSKAEIVQE